MAFKKTKFKSKAFEAIHSSAIGLFKAGLMDEVALRDFDESCLSVPIHKTAIQMRSKKTRNRLTGRFSYVLMNCIKYRPVQKDYVLKIPPVIRKITKWHVGKKLNFEVKDGVIVVSNKRAKNLHPMRRIKHQKRKIFEK